MSLISSYLDTAPASPGAAPQAQLRWALPLEHCAKLGAAQLGGKGLGLARMIERGLPVPAGLCIVADALDEFLQHNRLSLGEIWRSPDAERAAELAERIRKGRMPDALRTEILEGFSALRAASVAVRSSGIDEDSASHSFAGQHSTLLHVQGADAVLAAVQACWASLLNPAALAYRQSHAGLGTARMAVVIQRMVEAECAGVAFALNPLSGSEDELLIEACLGLGEGLVAGRVSSDSYVLDARSAQLLRQRIEYKPWAIGWDAQQQTLREQPVVAAKREAAVLDAARLQEIAALLQQLSREHGAPQDIEWAIAEGRLSLLQCRPITVTAKPLPRPTTPFVRPVDARLSEQTLWSRMDIGEIFTGRMSPLGISFAKHYQYKVHRDCGTGIGLLDLGDPDHYMGYLNGHVYLNVAYTAYLLAQSPPGFDQKPFVQRFSSEEVDVSAYANPYGEAYRHPQFSLRRTSGFWAWATLKELFSAKRRSRRMVASRYAEYDHALGSDLSRMDQNRLRQELTHALDYFKAMHVGYLPFYINAFGLYGLLEELCKAWMPKDGMHLQNRLKGDMSNLRTVQSARDLWALAQALREHPRAEALVRELPAAELAAALQADPDCRAFCRGPLAQFMRENGVRGHEEMELTHPRWVDDPSYVFQMLKTFQSRGYEVENRLGSRPAQGHDAGEALLAALPFGKRWLMRRVIAMYCACSRLREESRMAMITSIWMVRRVLYEAARRLVAEGVLHSEAEIAYLDFEDLVSWLNGYESAQSLFSRERVEAGRRLAQSWQVDEDPPLTFIGHAFAAGRSLGAAAEARAQAQGDLIKGLGTSLGQVRGRARVIHDLETQAGELQKGEIIVTHFTDASWTPLFALAGGIVTDIGSMLSHSSIVAREFGIPSVVNTKQATQRIRSGDLIAIDGETGQIIIEARAAH